MLALVMPDVKVLAGINVDQAKTTPFGQYVLSQIAPQDPQIQNLAALIGFDPRRDIHELLVASNGAAGHSGLALARGVFDPSKIAAAALLAGAKSETYDGLTILENQDQTAGIAFLDPSLAVMGGVAGVKAAMDRQKTPTALPASLAAQVSQWSLTQDAWAVAIVPPSTLKAPAGASQVPGLTQIAGSLVIQQAAGGVKFGPTVTVAIQAQTDTAQNAANLVGALQLLSNLAQAQASQDAQAASLWKSLVLTAQGNTVNLTLSVPEAQIEQLAKSRAAAATPATPNRVPVPRKKI
jgi:hypothetical protein